MLILCDLSFREKDLSMYVFSEFENVLALKNKWILKTLSHLSEGNS